MRELVIVSGKGGTGKTSLTAAFASLARNNVLCDADVDAADLHLLLQPEIRRPYRFYGRQARPSSIPIFAARAVSAAISAGSRPSATTFRSTAISCEGCGVCVDLCPAKAIDFPVQKCGEWFVSETRLGPMVHARLGHRRGEFRQAGELYPAGSEEAGWKKEGWS